MARVNIDILGISELKWTGMGEFNADAWVFSSCGVSVGFLTRYDGELREPLLWRQGSQVSMHVARGCASWLSSLDLLWGQLRF